MNFDYKYMQHIQHEIHLLQNFVGNNHKLNLVHLALCHALVKQFTIKGKKTTRFNTWWVDPFKENKKLVSQQNFSTGDAILNEFDTEGNEIGFDGGNVTFGKCSETDLNNGSLLKAADVTGVTGTDVIGVIENELSGDAKRIDASVKSGGTDVINNETWSDYQDNGDRASDLGSKNGHNGETVGNTQGIILQPRPKVRKCMLKKFSQDSKDRDLLEEC